MQEADESISILENELGRLMAQLISLHLAGHDAQNIIQEVNVSSTRALKRDPDAVTCLRRVHYIKHLIYLCIPKHVDSNVRV